MVVVAPSSLSHSLSHVAAIGLGSALKTLRLTHLASLPHHRPSLLGSWFPTELDKMAASCLLTLRRPPCRERPAPWVPPRLLSLSFSLATVDRRITRPRRRPASHVGNVVLRRRHRRAARRMTQTATLVGEAYTCIYPRRPNSVVPSDASTVTPHARTLQRRARARIARFFSDWTKRPPSRRLVSARYFFLFSSLPPVSLTFVSATSVTHRTRLAPGLVSIVFLMGMYRRERNAESTTRAAGVARRGGRS